MKKSYRFIAALLTFVILICIVPISYAENIQSEVCGFTLTETGKCELYDADTYLFTHNKTGGQVLYIANNDLNRTFDIAFKTPASDTGISHVFEHATLGGSDKYPNNIFFNVSSETFNTYMNAATAIQTTFYPISSLSDEQLLKLADYYLDGVFNPLILKDKRIFDREAWRYELENEASPLKLNGTVYNEMKGAVTPLNYAYYNSIRSMYPGSNKSVISGGDPEVIPTLKYEDVVSYHDKYYVPSNSLVILYGKLDYKKYLELLDGYFSKYDGEKPEITDPNYKPVTGEVRAAFEIQGNADSGNTVIYNIPCDTTDIDEIFRLISCRGLLASESSPLQINMKKEMPSVSFALNFDGFSFTKPTFSFIASNIIPCSLHHETAISSGLSSLQVQRISL